MPVLPVPATRTPATSVVHLRPARRSDLACTADWQVRHLPHGFFPSLGRRFVSRWHATHLDPPHGVALVAEVDDRGGPVAVGFLVGATDQAAHVRGVLAHHRGALLRSGAWALLGRPAVAVRFARTRARPYARRLLGGGRAPSAPTGTTPHDGAPPVAVVAAVVVEPAARGVGVGETLLAAFCERARAAGTRTAELVTTADGGAAAFYERLGWERVADRASRDGARVLTYRLDLAAPGSGDRTADDAAARGEAPHRTAPPVPVGGPARRAGSPRSSAA